jgi:hypothetical protein
MPSRSLRAQPSAARMSVVPGLAFCEPDSVYRHPSKRTVDGRSVVCCARKRPVVARFSFSCGVLLVEGTHGGGPACPLPDSDSPVARGPWSRSWRDAGIGRGPATGRSDARRSQESARSHRSLLVLLERLKPLARSRTSITRDVGRVFVYGRVVQPRPDVIGRPGAGTPGRAVAVGVL